MSILQQQIFNSFQEHIHSLKSGDIVNIITDFTNKDVSHVLISFLIGNYLNSEYKLIKQLFFFNAWELLFQYKKADGLDRTKILFLYKNLIKSFELCKKYVIDRKSKRRFKRDINYLQKQLMNKFNNIDFFIEKRMVKLQTYRNTNNTLYQKYKNNKNNFNCCFKCCNIFETEKLWYMSSYDNFACEPCSNKL
jgi:hypothetical protein